MMDFTKPFTRQTLYTDPGAIKKLLREIPPDFSAATDFIKKILIHPVDARNLGLRFNSKNVMRQHVFNRTVPDILGMPNVSRLLKYQAWKNSEPSQREILSCDHHSLLFTSLLREHGRSVRMRVGLAAYLVPDISIPHWLCEQQVKGAWLLQDPERCIEHVEKEQFRFIGEIWLKARAGAFDPDGVVVSNRRGWNALKYLLFCDVNALMGQEMLHYDWMITPYAPRKPKLFSKAYPRLDEEEREVLDHLALLSLECDTQYKKLEAVWNSVVRKENLRSAFFEE